MNTRWKFGAAALVLAASLGTHYSAANAVPHNVQIDGVARFAESGCDEAPSVFPPFDMQGSLEGCWYTTSYDVVQQTPSGTYQERGTELFVGCLNARGSRTCGTFTTEYHFEAKYSNTTGAEIHGRCQHPITGGTGGFVGASGRVDFKDDVATGCFYYRGHISLG